MLCGGTMLNPLTRICFGFGATILLAAAVAWWRVYTAKEPASYRLGHAAGFTSVGLFFMCAGIAAMMWLGPWARPYKYDPALEGAFHRDEAETAMD